MNLRLIVIRITLRQLLHGPGIGLNACAVIDFVVIGVHDRKRVDIVTFALRLGTDALPLGDGSSPFGEILRGRHDVRVPQHAQGNTPIGNAALRVGLQDILKDLL